MSIELLKEKYKSTAQFDWDLFEEWINIERVDIETVARKIVLNDERTTHIHELPKLSWIKNIYGSYGDNKGDKNLLSYIFDKTKNMSITDILLKCKKIRNEIKSEEWQKFDDWNKNSRIDFLHHWDVLSAEQEQAEKNGLLVDEVRTYLEIIKNAIVENKKWDRPWSSDYKMLELKRIAHVESFDKIINKATDLI